MSGRKMTPQGFGELETSLRERLRVLEERIEQIEAQLEAPGDDDFAESASESEGDETLEETQRTALEEVVQIRHALRRMEAGQYGICEDCGEEIPAARLNVLPFATRCVDCAQSRDQAS